MSGIGCENYLGIDVGDAFLPELIEDTLGLNFAHYVIDQSLITSQQSVGQAQLHVVRLRQVSGSRISLVMKRIGRSSWLIRTAEVVAVAGPSCQATRSAAISRPYFLALRAVRIRKPNQSDFLDLIEKNLKMK